MSQAIINRVNRKHETRKLQPALKSLQHKEAIGAPPTRDRVLTVLGALFILGLLVLFILLLLSIYFFTGTHR